MELRVLRYFLEVAREENVTHAAQRLHVSQPTLSRQIKELEDELGKKLFTRSNYSIKLTEEGMLLRKRYVLGFDGLVNTGPDSDICFRPLEPALESPMYIIWKKYQMFTPAASLLLEELKRNFGSL